MFIRPVSDLHNEFVPWDVPAMATDSNTVLVLAGDIDVRAKSADWMKHLSHRFKAIVMVLGNHDYWKDSLDKAPKRLKEKIANLGLANVHVLDRDTVIIDDPVQPVRFIGATLWTDFKGADPLAMYDAHLNMKDYSKIRNQGGRTNLHTRAILERHLGDRNYIKEMLTVPFEGHSIVVTHHAPSSRSTSDQYKTPAHKYGNAAYHSDLDEWAQSLVFTYWFHGHTHANFKYEFGAVGYVMCNPRGYAPKDLNPDFDAELLLDVSLAPPKIDANGQDRGKNLDYASWWETSI